MKALFFVSVLMFFACSTTDDDSTSQTEQYGKKRDAAVDSPPPVDAPAPGTAGWASCFTSGNPLAACNLSVNYCCFDNFVVPHNGSCTTGSNCGHSDEHCDGAEDCTSGQSCFASEWRDTGDMIHWSMTCATSAPTTINGQAVFGTEVMCTSSAQCSGGTTCQQANAVGLFDFSQKLYICR